LSFDTGERNHVARGKLADLLRVRELLAEHRPYRTQLVSAGAQRVDKTSLSSDPRLVVFDGAPGYIKWKHLWPSSHLAVILDRTEPRYYEAVAMLNEGFARKRCTPERLLSNGAVPAGMEIFAYREEA
jgi:hypothetical protein